MELQELTNIWNSTDTRIESTIKINKTLFMEVSASRIKTNLTSLRWTSYIEIIVNMLFLFFIVNFSISHFSELKFLIPALLLFAFSVYSIIFSVNKLSLHFGIKAQTPVLQTQKNLLKLQFLELKEKQLLYVIIPLFSPTFLIIGAKAFLGVDMYLLLNWLIAQTLASILIAVIIVFILNKFPDKKLQNTISFLSEISETENESN